MWGDFGPLASVQCTQQFNVLACICLSVYAQASNCLLGLMLFLSISLPKMLI